MFLRSRFDRRIAWSVGVLLPIMVAGAARGTSRDPRFVPKFTLEQATQVKTLRQCAVSPDGEEAACTLAGYYYTFPVIPRFGEENNLRLVSLRTGETRRLTTGPALKTQPLFSPDGRSVAFESLGDIWVTQVRDGATRRVTMHAAADGEAAWSPDGRSFVFVSSRHGQTDLWIVSVAGESDGVRRLTSDAGVESDPQWSPDGSTILYTSKRRDEYYSQGVFSVPHAGGAPKRLTPDDSLDHSTARWSPDGRQIAFLSDRDGYVHVWLMNADGSRARRFDTGPHDAMAPHWMVQPIWSRDGARILISVNHDASYHLVELSPSDGGVKTLGAGGGHYNGVGWTHDGAPAYIYENAWSPPDVFVGVPGSPQQKQLTFSSHVAFRKEHFASTKRVSFRSTDNLEVRGFLLLPPDLEPGERIPAIVNLHPNGYGQFYDYWDPFLHYLARSGYAMLLVDLRGSAGYGRAFRTAQIGAWGTKTMDDVRAAARFIRGRPFVDPERVGVMGLSFGGYHAALALTKAPELFRTGVNMMGPLDRRPPFSDPYRSYQIGATPEENPELYDRVSPITSVENITAPLLILHSDEDRNVPPEHTYRFIEALERHHKVFEAKIYPTEAHGLADPAHQLDSYERIVRFLDRYLRH